MSRASQCLKALRAESCGEVVSPDKRPLVDLNDSSDTSTDSDVPSNITDLSGTEAAPPSPPNEPSSEEPSGGADRHSDSDAEYEKPPHSYVALISMALLAAPERKCLLGDIYQYIMDKYPFYRYTPDKAWRNSIRHNLSLNECFIKSGRADNGKGNFWAIHPACEEDFAKGDFRRRQARRRARRSQQAQSSHAQRQNAGYVTMTSVPTGYGLPSADIGRNYGRSNRYHPYASTKTYHKENVNAGTTTSSSPPPSPPLTHSSTNYSNLMYPYNPQDSYHMAHNGYTSSSLSDVYSSHARATYSLTLTGRLQTPFQSSPFALPSPSYMASETPAHYSTPDRLSPSSTYTQGIPDTSSPVPYNDLSPIYTHHSSSDVSTDSRPEQSPGSSYLGYGTWNGLTIPSFGDTHLLHEALLSLASLAN